MQHDDWLTELYQTHKQLLLLVAWNFVDQRDAAEDAVHTAIVKLAQLAIAPTDPRGFAIRTVRNVAIDMMRKRHRSREEFLQGDESSTESQGVDERLSSIQNALQQLSSENRELIRLHLQGGLSFRAIGEALDEPIQTVASRYRRAIAKLRTMVEVNHE